MRTIGIPRDAWVTTLNVFTAIHEGWPVSLDVLGPEIGAQPEVTNLPLLGVSADRIDQDGTIAITVAGSTTAHLTHMIHAPTRVDVEQTDYGADAALNIQSADGTITILRFRAAAPPPQKCHFADSPAAACRLSGNRAARLIDSIVTPDKGAAASGIVIAS